MNIKKQEPDCIHNPENRFIQESRINNQINYIEMCRDCGKTVRKLNKNPK